eukprot:evm.model.scf_3744.1 EVM.evm.TU.scf_3744.1   scf_3744:471-1362(-)
MRGVALQSGAEAGSLSKRPRLAQPGPLRRAHQVRCVALPTPVGHRHGGANGAAPAGKPVLEVPGWESAPRVEAEPALRAGPVELPRLKVFSGTANQGLAQEVAHYLGLELGTIKIKRFADGEIYVQIKVRRGANAVS